MRQRQRVDRRRRQGTLDAPVAHARPVEARADAVFTDVAVPRQVLLRTHHTEVGEADHDGHSAIAQSRQDRRRELPLELEHEGHVWPLVAHETGEAVVHFS